MSALELIPMPRDGGVRLVVTLNDLHPSWPRRACDLVWVGEFADEGWCFWVDPHDGKRYPARVYEREVARIDRADAWPSDR